MLKKFSVIFHKKPQGDNLENSVSSIIPTSKKENQQALDLNQHFTRETS